MRSREITARRRAVGAELRNWREHANLSAADIAHRLSWSQAKVSNMEHGRRTISEVDAATYLAVCRAPGQDIQEILTFFHATEGTWVQLHGDQMSDQLRSLVALETTAAAIWDFQLAVVPGLLQTEDYARSLMTQAGLAPTRAIEPRVRVRKNRQTLLHRHSPPRFVFFIHENALRLSVGDDGIMNDQLLNLVFASARPHVDLRVIPCSAGPHAGLGGAFALLEYATGNPVVYLDNDVASLFADGPPQVAHYRAVLAQLEMVALDEGQSRSFLADLASEHDRPRGDHDDLVRAEGPLA